MDSHVQSEPLNARMSRVNSEATRRKMGCGQTEHGRSSSASRSCLEKGSCHGRSQWERNPSRRLPATGGCVYLSRKSELGGSTPGDCDGWRGGLQLAPEQFSVLKVSARLDSRAEGVRLPYLVAAADSPTHIRHVRNDLHFGNNQEHRRVPETSVGKAENATVLPVGVPKQPRLREPCPRTRIRHSRVKNVPSSRHIPSLRQ